MNLKDKIVVVTGSSRGFGFAIAESLLEAGATVAVTGRNQQTMTNSLIRLQPKGRVSGLVLDVRNEEQIYKLVEDVVREFGRIDIWINNAGYSNAAGMMLDMNPQDALDMFMSNDLGVLQCTQAIMRHMLPRKQGLLVNIYGNGSFLRPLRRLDCMARQRRGRLRSRARWQLNLKTAVYKFWDSAQA